MVDYEVFRSAFARASRLMLSDEFRVKLRSDHAVWIPFFAFLACFVVTEIY